VTFVVPCYKLAHLLPECVNSILSQTYADFEILIMDDCSPDSTAEVARSFTDKRVKYIRNETNLGHLRNYNKGILMAEGEYIWLISADDRLRNPRALETYVQFLKSHPKVGYVFSSGMFLQNGQETSLIVDSWWGPRDIVFKGHDFFVRLYRGDANIVCPSCLVRKDCYATVSMFPLDMPHAADRYLWSLWALTYDVAYFAEPMVDYRIHDLNIMKTLRRSRIVTTDMLAWQSRMREKAEEAGHSQLASTWLSNVSNLYVYALLSDRFQLSPHCMNFDEFEESLNQHTRSAGEKKNLRARVYAGFADGCYERGDFAETLQFYRKALREVSFMPNIWAKYTLLRLGKLGITFRRAARDLRPLLTRRPRTSSTPPA